MKGITFTPEAIRVEYVEFDGTRQVQFKNISGPAIEAERTLTWMRRLIERDGGKVVGAVLGTVQNGVFRAEQRRPVPVIARDGYRRISSHLRG